MALQDIHVTGAARIAPAPSELKPARWALRPARLARMDRLCALALVAADAALLDAGIDVAAWRGERVAVVVGSAFGCHATNEQYYRGLLTEGPRGASPRLFAYTLPSSPVGEISIHYVARGPLETLVSGRHAGVEAVARAARLCDAALADVAIAVAVETGSALLTSLGHAVVDGAAAVVIERGATARERGACLRAEVRGAGSSFHAGDPANASTAAGGAALAEAGLPASTQRLPIPPDAGAVAAVATLAAWLLGGGDDAPVSLAVSDEAGGAAAIALVPSGAR